MNEKLIPTRPEYYVQTGSMFENPYGVPHPEIVAMIRELPAEMAAQVIFGKYVESSGLVFTGELIQMMMDRNARHYADRWDKEFRVTGDRWVDDLARDQAAIWPQDAKRNRFATGVDFARKTDYTVIITLDVMQSPARVVYYRRLNRVPWENIYLQVGRAAHIFGPNVLADSTGMAGDVIFSNLEDRRYCPTHDRIIQNEMGVCMDRHRIPLPDCKESLHVSLGCVEGFDFNTKSKANLVEHLRNVGSVGYRSQSDEEYGLIRMPPIAQVEEEMSFYAWDDKGLETDTVMALALAAWAGLDDVPGASVIGGSY